MIIKKVNLLASSVVVLALSGCSFNDVMNSRLEFIPNDTQACMKPEGKNSIEVFRSSMPKREFIEMGTVSSQYSSYGKALGKIKALASKNCADALIDIREASVGVMVSLNATAIKFK